MNTRTTGRVTVWILGDQLSLNISSLHDLSPSDCVVFMVESLPRARALPYHKQKLVLVWSAMRHFALELRELGYEVDYRQYQDDLAGTLRSHIDRFNPSTIRIMESAEYGRSGRLERLVHSRGVATELTPNNMFLSDKEEFARYASGKKTLLMESFYRRMRRKSGLLMEGDRPEGGKWNYDDLNREKPPSDHQFPKVHGFDPDAVTKSVMDYVNAEFPDNFGEIEGFAWPVSRSDARGFLEDFLDRRLDLFGPYEDAIVSGQPALYHSLLSPLLNIGLVDPMDACRRAEERYRAGKARLNSVEGFIRQIIGWREFVYQVYHLRMPEYEKSNHFSASLRLPEFYWTGETKMACVADAIGNLRRSGTNHHIQRLMITGNFALIAGIDPQQVNEWYRLAYIDAYDWVVTPNVLGLSLFADGGLLATKPYAASANYINRMSNLCGDCVYDRRKSTGEDACPFNSLYWDFLARNENDLNRNPRMKMIVASLSRRNRADLSRIMERSDEVRSRLAEAESCFL